MYSGTFDVNCGDFVNVVCVYNGGSYCEAPVGFY